MMKFSMKAYLITAALLGLAATPGRAQTPGPAQTPGSAQSPILPGYWESVNHTEFVIEEDTTSRKCITAELAQSYLNGPVNSHYTCVYDHREIGDGRIALGGQCVDSGVKARVNVTGTYTPTSFDLTAQLAAKLFGLPVTGEATTKAHRISDTCPVAEAK